jgi:hypothetical protein
VRTIHRRLRQDAGDEHGPDLDRGRVNKDDERVLVKSLPDGVERRVADELVRVCAYVSLYSESRTASRTASHDDNAGGLVRQFHGALDFGDAAFHVDK